MQTRVVRGVATAIEQDEQGTHVRYHSTRVVTIHLNGDVTLRTGGYRTNTTKCRMNQAANQYGLGFHVYQQDFGWFIQVGKLQVPFIDRELTIKAEMLRKPACPCQCSDWICSVHTGTSTCSHPATRTLFRIDMEDQTGTAFCDGCAEDAMNSGLFREAHQ